MKNKLNPVRNSPARRDAISYGIKKAIAAALFPIVLSTNLTALLDNISAAPSLADLSNRLVEYFKLTPPEPEYQKIEVIATAYSSTSDQTDDDPHTTAANTKTREGVVAANFLNLHSRIQIPKIYGDQIFTIEDRMNRRFTDVIPPRIDIWMPDRHLAKQFGVKKTEIIILE